MKYEEDEIIAKARKNHINYKYEYLLVATLGFGDLIRIFSFTGYPGCERPGFSAAV